MIYSTQAVLLGNQPDILIDILGRKLLDISTFRLLVDLQQGIDILKEVMEIQEEKTQ